MKISSKIKFFTFFLTIITACLSVVTVASASCEYNWYCVHRKDHKQPVADSNLSFIEKYNGYYIDKAHGDNECDKVIYLTFDAGYENGNVERILDVLKKENVPAAFFVLGNLVCKNSNLVKRMFEEGHLVCNHTRNHKNLSSATKSEIADNLSSLERIYTEETGKTMSKYFRFPEGEYSLCALQYLNELGYKSIFWSFAYDDWDNNRQPSKEAAIKKILENTHNGAVILLHPTSKTNAEILPTLISEWRKMGYTFGTLDDLTS